jgi:hypothetical protein
MSHLRYAAPGALCEKLCPFDALAQFQQLAIFCLEQVWTSRRHWRPTFVVITWPASNHEMSSCLEARTTADKRRTTPLSLRSLFKCPTNYPAATAAQLKSRVKLDTRVKG